MKAAPVCWETPSSVAFIQFTVVIMSVILNTAKIKLLRINNVH